MLPQPRVDSQDEVIPLNALLQVPACPPAPPGSEIISFTAFKGKGYQKTLIAHQIDLSLSLKCLPLIPIQVDEAKATTQSQEAQGTSLATSRGGLVFLPLKDSWRIGKLGDSWSEPIFSSVSNYDVHISPFNRLLSATRDFMASRRDAFAFSRTKLLFNILRNAFGIRATEGVDHWSSAPSFLAQRASQRQRLSGESCVLLLDTVTSVRGFLATVRREAEAGWELEAALELAVITAAFLSFLSFHRVLPDIAGFPGALHLARAAPQQLIEAKQVEDVLCGRSGLNRTSWTLWGGVYGGPERGGNEQTSVWKTDEGLSHDAISGGWGVQSVFDHRPKPLTLPEALPFISSLILPIRHRDVRLLEYIPYARRKVVEILGPLEMSDRRPGFMSTALRLVTAAAPWTVEEKWRPRRPRFDDEGSDDDVSVLEDGSFEKELATSEIPEKLIIWIENDNLRTLDKSRLLGMGLRGRWALLGDGIVSWWIFKSKDYVLPSFWQSVVPPRDSDAEEGVRTSCDLLLVRGRISV